MVSAGLLRRTAGSRCLLVLRMFGCHTIQDGRRRWNHKWKIGGKQGKIEAWPGPLDRGGKPCTAWTHAALQAVARRSEGCADKPWQFFGNWSLIKERLSRTRRFAGPRALMRTKSTPSRQRTTLRGRSEE